MLNITHYQRNANQNYNEIYSYTGQNWPPSKNPEIINAGEDVEKKGTLLHCWWKCKLIKPLWKTVQRFLKKLGIKLLYEPAIPLLGTYPQETITEKDTGTPMFTDAVFIIARTWKQPRCPLTDEWIKKVQYIYTIEYYSAIKRNVSQC